MLPAFVLLAWMPAPGGGLTGRAGSPATPTRDAERDRAHRQLSAQAPLARFALLAALSAHRLRGLSAGHGNPPPPPSALRFLLPAPPGSAPLQRLAAALTVAIVVVGGLGCCLSNHPAWGRLSRSKNSSAVVWASNCCGVHLVCWRGIGTLLQFRAWTNPPRLAEGMALPRAPVLLPLRLCLISVAAAPDRCAAGFACWFPSPSGLWLFVAFHICACRAGHRVVVRPAGGGQWRISLKRRLRSLSAQPLSGPADMPWVGAELPPRAAWGRCLSIAIGAPGGLIARSMSPAGPCWSAPGSAVAGGINRRPWSAIAAAALFQRRLAAHPLFCSVFGSLQGNPATLPWLLTGSGHRGGHRAAGSGAQNGTKPRPERSGVQALLLPSTITDTKGGAGCGYP